MTGATPKYGDARDRLPMIEAGQSLSLKQIELLAAALRGRAASAKATGDKAAANQFACDDLLCLCEGVDDCIDMFESGSCGDGFCFGDGAGGTICICIQA